MPCQIPSRTFPKWTEYIKVNYYTYKVGDSQNKLWDHDKLIDQHPDIANGWTKEGLWHWRPSRA